MSRVRRQLASFGNAFHGWAYGWRTQQNLRTHVFITAAVFAVALWVGLPRSDWAIILITTAVVFAAEFLNTAVEAVVDLVSPQPHPLAKAAKDVAAAAVLLAALAAVLVGVMILGPSLLARLSA